MSASTRAAVDELAEILGMNPKWDDNSKVRLLKKMTRMLEKPVPDFLKVPEA